MSFRKGNGGFQRTCQFLKRHCLSDVIMFWEPPTGNSVESSQKKKGGAILLFRMQK